MVSVFTKCEIIGWMFIGLLFLEGYYYSMGGYSYFIGLILIGFAFSCYVTVRREMSVWFNRLLGHAIGILDEKGVVEKTISDETEAAAYMKPRIKHIATNCIIYATIGFLLLWGGIIAGVLIGGHSYSNMIWGSMILVTLVFVVLSLYLVYHRGYIWGDKTY